MSFNSLLNESDVEFWFRLQYNVVSSAYISISNILLTEGRSLIYIRNNSGPNIDPCGTPVAIEALFDFIFHIQHIETYLLNNCVINDTQRCKYRNILVCEEGWNDRGNQKPLKDQCKDVE